MSTYSIDLNQQLLLRQALIEGGHYRCRLDRPGSSIRPRLHVELTDTSIEIEVEMGGSCNRITLPRHDGANLQALAEFVEGIANGTNDSAESVVPARVPRSDTEPAQLSPADQETIRHLVLRGGVEQLQCGARIAAHPEQHGKATALHLSASLGVALQDFAKGRGQSEVARLIGVTQGSVSQMLKSGREIHVRQLACGSYQAIELKVIGAAGTASGRLRDCP